MKKWLRLNKIGFKISSSGFVLIELLVVVAIIGVLAGGLVTVVNPVSQLQKAQDTKRKSDLSQIEKALELYFQDNGKYPVAINNSINGVDWGTAWTPYMSILPKDPNSPTKKYVYASTGQNYYLYASLDKGENDPQACNGENACASLTENNIEEAACGGICNYEISLPMNIAGGLVSGPTPSSSPPVQAPPPGPISTSTPTITPISTPAQVHLEICFPTASWKWWVKLGSVSGGADKGQNVALALPGSAPIMLESSIYDQANLTTARTMYGPYMVTFPSSGTYCFIGNGFAGVSFQYDLLTSGNKAQAEGEIVGFDPWTDRGPMYNLRLDKVEDIPGFPNSAKYFLGQTIETLADLPTDPDPGAGGYPLITSGKIKGTLAYTKQSYGSSYMPQWFLSNARNANVNPGNYTGSFTFRRPDMNRMYLDMTISGTPAPFIWTVTQTYTGTYPVSTGIGPGSATIPISYPMSYSLYANSNSNTRAWSSTFWVFDGWQFITSFSTN